MTEYHITKITLIHKDGRRENIATDRYVFNIGQERAKWKKGKPTVTQVLFNYAEREG